MAASHTLEEFAPLFEEDSYTEGERAQLGYFFSNVTKSVYAPLIMSPEVVGALCSRTSRAAGDLRTVFLREYVLPFLDPEREANDDDASWKQKQEYAGHLAALMSFLDEHPVDEIFSNPRARSFYAKWLAQYGDDSIAQMAGAHLVFSSLSQLTIKHFEDQRIGLAPIEKSTRYVDYSQKVQGQYRYYIDPQLKDWGLEDEYRTAMDGLFEAYSDLIPRLSAWLAEQFPEEKAGVVEKKAFDSLRGLLPMATLSQVAFFGNGQAFEYMVARSAKHRLGEVRWAADQAYEELYQVVPAFLRRLRDPESLEVAEEYQEYLAGRADRLAQAARDQVAQPSSNQGESAVTVKLLEYDPEGEAKVVAGMLYSATENAASWEETLGAAARMSATGKREVLDAYLEGRDQRWQKVGRALENVYLRYEIMMDIGSWRDLHRHRMLSQQRQLFTTAHGYVTPREVVEAGLTESYEAAMDKARAVFEMIAEKDVHVAQYAVPMGYHVRFMQWTNVRECFWEMELRTIPEGHPDYRFVEQEKFRLFQEVYPLLAEYMRVNMGDYDFARRGQEEKIQEKLRSLERV